MSDNSNKIIILRRDIGIDWDGVYRSFERRFIETHYENWRKQFNMDACNSACQRSDLFVGQIVACWLD